MGNEKSNPALKRYPGNPVLSATDVPYHATLVFNAGITKFNGKYVMLFRNDYGDEAAKRLDGTMLGIAFSDDGLTWTVRDTPLVDTDDHPLTNAYDPRLTVLDGRCYLCFAIDIHDGVCDGVAVTDDLEHWEVLNVCVPDNRNMVIFPERIGGKIVRLERPFASYMKPGHRFDMWMSASPDGRYWGEAKFLLAAEDVPWSNNKVGPAAPPVRTEKGWLAFFHAVDTDEHRILTSWKGDWRKRYTVGVMLLDLDDPSKLIGFSRTPVMVPEEAYPYEVDGYRGSVIFPGGMILEDDGEVKMYYGASDTVECLATMHVDELLACCEPV